MARISREDITVLLARTVAPGVVLWGVVVAVGLLITRVLKDLDRREDRITDAFNRNRTDFWDPVSWICSRLGNTEVVIGVCLVAVVLIWWRTRDWRWAAVPAIAISVQATIFLFATIAVGRQRPPAIPMDSSPPTSSYPSGHTGASTALYVSFLLLAQHIERAWLRRLVTCFCALVPFLVGTARLYRGAHHVSDVVMAMVNGLTCALLAYGWWRHRARALGTGIQPDRPRTVAVSS
jgi:undecaprenyl-diphosphatase